MEPTVNRAAIERLERILGTLTPKAKRLVASEIKRQGMAARKALLQTMTAHYAIKQKDIKDGLKVRITQGTSTTAAIQTVGEGRYKLAAYKFAVTQKNVQHMARGKYHKLRLLKNGSAKAIKKGFIVKMRSGHEGFFERTETGIIQNRRAKAFHGITKHNAKISEITGLAMAQMVKEDEVKVIFGDAQRAIAERLERLIEKVKRGEMH